MFALITTAFEIVGLLLIAVAVAVAIAPFSLAGALAASGVVLLGESLLIERFGSAS